MHTKFYLKNNHMSINREIFLPNRQISSYKIIKMIGRGAYGDVYLVTDSRNLKNYAMKTESIDAAKQTLSHEVDLLFDAKIAYFPAIRGYGEEPDCRYYVMDVLGPALSKVIRQIRKNKANKVAQIQNNDNNNLRLSTKDKFSSNLLTSTPGYLNVSLKSEENLGSVNATSTPDISNAESNSSILISSDLSLEPKPTSNLNSLIDLKTFYAIAEETLKILEYLHTQLGIVHRDIKPSNFLLRPRSNAPLCLVDFGLAKRYIDKATNLPIPPSTKKRFTGTLRYASPNAHMGLDLAPRDDLYSWFYMMLEIRRNGKLPWGKVNDRLESLEMKQKIYVHDNCDELPERFASIYRTISGLTYDSMPDYARLFSMLESAKKTDNIDTKLRSKKKKKSRLNTNLDLNLDNLDDDDDEENVWDKLMRVIPEAMEIVPEETEQLKTEFIANESERWKRNGSVYGIESPLISAEDQYSDSDAEKKTSCPCIIF